MTTLPRLAGVRPRPGPRPRRLRLIAILSAGLLVATWAPSPAGAQQPAPNAPAAKPPEAAPGHPKDERAREQAVRAELTKEKRESFPALFLAEIRFIRTTSGATEEQARRIAHEARGPLRSSIAEWVDKETAIMRSDDEPEDFDPGAAYRSIKEILAAIAKDQLSPDQWARYRDQAAKRADHRKRTAIRNLMAELDHALRLSADQRDRIAGSVAAHWNPAWEDAGISVEEFELFPKIPDPVIAPFLTAGQKALWDALPKGIEDTTSVAEIIVTIDDAAADPLRAELDPIEEPAAAPKR